MIHNSRPLRALSATPESTRVMFVGHLGAKEAISPALAEQVGQDIVVVDYLSVSAETLASFRPHFVVSPVFTPSFDIMELAHRLWQLKFAGAYRAMTEQTLPNPELILREVRGACPGLDVDILSICLIEPPEGHAD